MGSPQARRGVLTSPERKLDAWIRPFFRDFSLLPVLLVAVGILATFGAATLVLAVQARRLPAIAALLLLIWLSIEALRPDLRARRLGPVGALVLGLWLISGLVAVAAIRLGLA